MHVVAHAAASAYIGAQAPVVVPAAGLHKICAAAVAVVVAVVVVLLIADRSIGRNSF